jgi:hypothetical protein
MENIVAVKTNAEPQYTVEEIAENLSFETLEKAYGEYETKLEEIETEKKLIHDAILLKFEKTYGHQSQTFINPETNGKLGRVLQVTQKVDQAAGKKLLTKEQFVMVSVTAIDKDKLLAAIKIGQVNPRIIAPALLTKEIDKLIWSNK